MQIITKTEASHLRFIAVLELVLAMVSAVGSAVGWTALKPFTDKPLEHYMDKAFVVSFIFIGAYSAIVLLSCLVVVFAKGAEAVGRVLRMQSIALFGYSILSLYVSVCTLYLVVGWPDVKSLYSLFVTIAVVCAIASVFVIFVAVKMPYMIVFMKDLEPYPKGADIRLIRFACACSSGDAESVKRAGRTSSRRVVSLRVPEDDEEHGIILRKP